MAASNQSLKEYLKRYESKEEEEKRKKKKQQQKEKRKAEEKKKAEATGHGSEKTKKKVIGVVVVDADPDWRKPVEPPKDDDDDSAGEDKPVVEEDIEVKRSKRLELVRAKRPFNSISEDGSGWVPIGHSPPRGSNSDISPPRRQRTSLESESMPVRIKKDDVDLSTPREHRKRHHTPSPDPATNQDHFPTSSGLDLSPPRKSRNHNNADISPPRKNRKDVDSDISPPRKSRKEVDADLSPARKSRNEHDTDLSPPRKIKKNGGDDLSPPRKKVLVPPGPLKEQRKVGLISGRDISNEITKTKKDEWSRFQQMDPSVSGREATPVYRDKKTGQRISKEELLKSQRKLEEKPKEIKLEWGKGLAQKREAETNLEELELEKEKPFARTRDDPDLDRMMKEAVRWGDPMAHLVKKTYPEPVLPNLGDDERMMESGFIIPQDIPAHSWLKRRLDAAPNRYGIKPGRHWDGVDRSNGFEKGMFKRKNEKQATETEAYLWSVADM